jgi:hypothetical protein
LRNRDTACRKKRIANAPRDEPRAPPLRPNASSFDSGGKIMHGHLETASTSTVPGGGNADEAANTRTAETSPSSDALELAFDAVGTAIEAFLDALS